jgi:hypothetical protein
MRLFLSFFRRARMSFDISFPRFLGLSDSESELEELEELELLPPGVGLGGGTTPLGGLLSLDSIVLPLRIEPLPNRSLCGGGGRSYSDSISSLFRRGILPHQAHCSRMLSIYLFIYTSYSLATVRLWRRLQIMVHCQVPGCYVCYLLGFAPERSFVLGL